MQGTAWVSLFQRIPADQHDSVMLMTTNGTEIVIQRLIILANDFVVAMARLSGSTDQAKVLVIPYDQLTYLSLNKQMTDSEVEAVLGSGDSVVKSTAPRLLSPSTASTSTRPEPAEVTRPAANTVSISSNADTPLPANGADHAADKTKKAPQPSRASLLARLRQRLADDIGSKTKQ